MASGHFGEEVGRGRRDDDQIGFARQADVANLVLVVQIEEFGEHALVGQGRHRQGRHELGRRTRHHRAHGGAFVAQASDEVEALIGGNAAADDEQDALLLHLTSPPAGFSG